MIAEETKFMIFYLRWLIYRYRYVQRYTVVPQTRSTSS